MSFREKLRLTWELTWPLAVLDLAVVFLLHGILDVSGETYDSIWALVMFFAISPWVIQRAFRQSYGGRRIAVVRVPALPAAIRYQETLKVMWLLAWRTLVLMLVALVPLSMLLRAAGITGESIRIESPLVNALGVSLVDTATSILFTPLLLPSMLRKKYRGFRLELVPAR